MNNMQYAKDTSVSSEQSQAEIRKTLTRYGATKFAYLEEEERAVIMFEISNRRIRFVLPLPNRNDPRFWETPGRNLKRAPDAAFKEWEQASRQRWRALAKAKAKTAAPDGSVKAALEALVALAINQLSPVEAQTKLYELQRRVTRMYQNHEVKRGAKI